MILTFFLTACACMSMRFNFRVEFARVQGEMKNSFAERLKLEEKTEARIADFSM